MISEIAVMSQLFNCEGNSEISQRVVGVLPGCSLLTPASSAPVVWSLDEDFFYWENQESE